MSLSKYYRNSAAFQPEQLIKQAKPVPKNWQRTLITDLSAEQPTLPPLLSPDVEHSQESQNSGTAQDEAWGNLSVPHRDDRLSAERRADGDSSLGSLPLLGLDPANYMEKHIAEEKINAAFRLGLEEGMKNAEKDFGDALGALLNTCRLLDTVRETLISNSREEFVQLALAIAERIVRTSVREQDNTIAAAIEEALQRAVKSEEFTIYLHPEDHRTISRKADELIASVSGLKNIVIKQDDAIERGGARIESDNCTVDCTIDGQFDLIREELSKPQAQPRP